MDQILKIQKNQKQMTTGGSTNLLNFLGIKSLDSGDVQHKLNTLPTVPKYKRKKKEQTPSPFVQTKLPVLVKKESTPQKEDFVKISSEDTPPPSSSSASSSSSSSSSSSLNSTSNLMPETPLQNIVPDHGKKRRLIIPTNKKKKKPKQNSPKKQFTIPTIEEITQFECHCKRTRPQFLKSMNSLLNHDLEKIIYNWKSNDSFSTTIPTTTTAISNPSSKIQEHVPLLTNVIHPEQPQDLWNTLQKDTVNYVYEWLKSYKPVNYNNRKWASALEQHKASYTKTSSSYSTKINTGSKFPPTLLISGDCGIGKTSMIKVLGKATGYTHIYEPYLEAANDKSKNVLENIQQFLNTPCDSQDEKWMLLLDDFDCGTVSGPQLGIFIQPEDLIKQLKGPFLHPIVIIIDAKYLWKPQFKMLHDKTTNQESVPFSKLVQVQANRLDSIHYFAAELSTVDYLKGITLQQLQQFLPAINFNYKRMLNHLFFYKSLALQTIGNLQSIEEYEHFGGVLGVPTDLFTVMDLMFLTQGLSISEKLMLSQHNLEMNVLGCHENYLAFLQHFLPQPARSLTNQTWNIVLQISEYMSQGNNVHSFVKNNPIMEIELDLHYQNLALLLPTTILSRWIQQQPKTHSTSSFIRKQFPRSFGHQTKLRHFNAKLNSISWFSDKTFTTSFPKELDARWMLAQSFRRAINSKHLLRELRRLKVNQNQWSYLLQYLLNGLLHSEKEIMHMKKLHASLKNCLENEKQILVTKKKLNKCMDSYFFFHFFHW